MCHGVGGARNGAYCMLWAQLFGAEPAPDAGKKPLMRVDTRPRLNNSAGGLSHSMSQRVMTADVHAEQKDAVQTVRGGRQGGNIAVVDQR